jgi:hypothetical protein
LKQILQLKRWFVSEINSFIFWSLPFRIVSLGISHESKTGQYWGVRNTNIEHFGKIALKNPRVCPSR